MIYLTGVLVAWIICVIGSWVHDGKLLVKHFDLNCAIFFSWLAVGALVLFGIAILIENIDWDKIEDKRIL